MGAFWLDLGEYRGPARARCLVGYMVERRVRRAELTAWKCYVADSLNLIPQNKFISRRYSDLIRKTEDFDAEAVVAGVLKAIGAEVSEDGNAS